DLSAAQRQCGCDSLLPRRQLIGGESATTLRACPHTFRPIRSENRRLGPQVSVVSCAQAQRLQPCHTEQPYCQKQHGNQYLDQRTAILIPRRMNMHVESSLFTHPYWEF